MITGIVLAGGKSKRMGRDKGLMMYGNKPLVQHSIDLLSAFTNDILIVTDKEEYGRFGYPLVTDEIPGCGPLGGLYSGLKASGSDQNIVVGCDMPYLSKAFLDYLINAQTGFDVVVPMHLGMLEPLAALYSKSILDHIETNIRMRNFKLANSIYKSRYLELPIGPEQDFYNADIFKNINEPKDL